MAISDSVFGRWILGSMGSGVLAIDSEHAVVMMNDGARRILGCPAAAPASLLGRDCREVLAAQPAVAHLLIDALASRSPLSRAELALDAGGEGGGSTIGFTLSPVRDEAGQVRGAAMIFRDLTPFERMDEQDRLRERLTALGQMAADLAHEIRNPLAGMQVIAGLLERRLADRPEECALVKQIMGELRSVGETVTASLEFVRPTGLERRQVVPAELVEEAIDIARARVPFSGVIERRFASELPEINADPDQLRSVVTNLIVNAFEAMAASGGDCEQRLAVSMRLVATDRNMRFVRLRSDGRTASSRDLSRRELVIEVADSGSGVASDLREKVFYPFFTTKQQGSGVGLAAAQKIIASHGGSIELDGREGEGATFRIRLPVAESEAERSAERNWDGPCDSAAPGGDA